MRELEVRMRDLLSPEGSIFKENDRKQSKPNSALGTPKRATSHFAWKPDVIFHAEPSFRRVYIRLATQFPHHALIDRPSSTHCDGPSAVPIPACSSRCAATWTASCRCATFWAAPRCTGPIIRFAAIPAEDDEANDYHETESQGTRSKCHCRLRV